MKQGQPELKEPGKLTMERLNLAGLERPANRAGPGLSYGRQACRAEFQEIITVQMGTG